MTKTYGRTLGWVAGAGSVLALSSMAIAETAPRQEGNQMHTILSGRAGAKRTAPKPPREAAAAPTAPPGEGTPKET